MVLTQWFNLGLSASVVKKLLSISPFVTKVPFVALKLILSNSLCMITWFKLVFSEIPLCKYCFIYTCALFCLFSGSIFTKIGHYSRKQRFKYVKHDFRVLAPTSIKSKGKQGYVATKRHHLKKFACIVTYPLNWAKVSNWE